MTKSKTELRKSLLELPAKSSGKMGKQAENLRKQVSYRQCSCICIPPLPGALQLRMNALLDGKRLLVPTPGLKEGFYFFEPHSIAFKEMGNALIPRGFSSYGSRVNEEDWPHKVDLFCCVDVLVDKNGMLLGDGSGFADLTYAILSARKALAPEAMITAIGRWADYHADTVFARDEWDIQADLLVTDKEVVSFASSRSTKKTSICWDQLPPKRIRKISSLYKLSKQTPA